MRSSTTKSRRMLAMATAVAVAVVVLLALRAYQDPGFLLGFVNIGMCN